MTDLPSLPPESHLAAQAVGDRAIRLILAIPQIAIPKKVTLPAIANPWQSFREENATWGYRFMLDTVTEVDAAIQLVYAPGLKWDRIVVLGWGVPLWHNYVGSVLACLRKSYESEDYRAHCWTGRRAVTMEQEIGQITYRIGHKDGPIKEVYDLEGQRIPDPCRAPVFLHPCRFAQSWQPLTTMHPSGIRAQIEAGLIDRGCRWCPRLDHLDQWEQHMWGRQPHGPSGPPVIDDGAIQ